MSGTAHDPLPRAAPIIITGAGLVVALAALGSSLPAHHWWGRIAVGGYLAALATALVPSIRHHWWKVAVVLCGALPLAVLVIGRARGWHHVAQSEVDVIESGARRLLLHATPYRDPARMSAADATTNYSYFPYLPAMTVPGLPRALLGRHWFTDARLWMVAFDTAMLRIAWRRLRPATRRAILAIAASPLVTLLVSAGGHDLLVASSLVAGYLVTDWALGLAASFTVLGWPLTIPALFVRDGEGRWGARRVAIVAGVVTATAAPILIDPAAAWANIVDFPAGRTPARSPADAPSVGQLLKALPGGTLWVALLVAVIGIALVVSLIRLPPESPAAAARRGAIAFLCLVLAVPSTRAGYLIHPATLGALAWGELAGRTDEDLPA